MTTSIPVFCDIATLRRCRRQWLLAGEPVGFVPTMGALHAGHLALVRSAARETRHVVVSIYVNPAQFGAAEDLGAYPRTWDADMRALQRLDAELASAAASTSSASSSSSLPHSSPSLSPASHPPSSSSLPPPPPPPLPPSFGRISGVFAPTTAAMYPTGPLAAADTDANAVDGSFVTIHPLGSVLEGAVRPGFFRGVATVCMKLFHIVAPERAYFGQKDVQQALVVQRMVHDFCIDMRVRVGRTVRDATSTTNTINTATAADAADATDAGDAGTGDGLALSSRNAYLGARRRRVAPVLYAALQQAAAAFTDPHRCRRRRDILAPAERLLADAARQQEQLAPHERARFAVDYLSLADPRTLAELDEVSDEHGAVLSGAIRMLPIEAPSAGEDCGIGSGSTGGSAMSVRLIDNIILGRVATLDLIDEVES